MARWGTWLLLLLLGFPAVAIAQFTFQQRSYAGIGYRLLRADLNNDGFPDLLGHGYGGVTFMIMLNSGNGTFQPPRSIGSLQGWLSSVIATDWNNDGNVDVVACYSPSVGTPVLNVWYGNGAAEFSEPATLYVTGACSGVTTADFNHDGRLDLVATVVSRNPDGTPNNSVTVFFGDGAGHVTSSLTTTNVTAMSSSGPCSFGGTVSGDFDRDGQLDLVVDASCPNDVFNQDTLVFARGDGSGHFTFATGGSYSSLEIRKDDVDQDNRLDLIVRGYYSAPHASGGSSVDFLLGSPANGGINWNTAYWYGYSYYAAPDYVSSVSGGTAADLDGDGFKDAVVLEDIALDDWLGPMQSNIVITPGAFGGTAFGPPQKLYRPHGASDVVWGDFDRDGRIDLVLAGPSSTDLFLNRTPAATCPANATLRTVRICAPSQIASTSLHLQANTTSSHMITGMWVYVDNTGVFFTPNDLINRVLNLTPGGHRLTVRAWDTKGAFSSAAYVSVGTAFGCRARSTNRSINLCFPTKETTVGSPMQVVAAVRDSHSYYGAKIYIDGKARYSTSARNVSTSVPLSAGRHRVTIQASDNLGAFATTTYVIVR